MDIQPCHRCGTEAQVYQGGSYWGNSISCDNCYDGSEDSRTRGECVDSNTPERAIAEWNEMQIEMKEEA